MNRQIKQRILTFILLLIFNCSYGQDTVKCNPEYFSDALLERLTGNWIATGSVGRDKVNYTFSVNWILNHQFLEMDFADQLAKHEYTAKVLIGYDCPEDKYVIHWIDNMGGRFSETLGFGERKNEAIEMVFKYPEGQLINTFSYSKANNTWRSHSTVKNEKGEWVTFGDISMKRGK